MPLAVGRFAVPDLGLAAALTTVAMPSACSAVVQLSTMSCWGSGPHAATSSSVSEGALGDPAVVEAAPITSVGASPPQMPAA